MTPSLLLSLWRVVGEGGGSKKGGKGRQSSHEKQKHTQHFQLDVLEGNEILLWLHNQMAWLYPDVGELCSQLHQLWDRAFLSHSLGEVARKRQDSFLYFCHLAGNQMRFYRKCIYIRAESSVCSLMHRTYMYIHYAANILLQIIFFFLVVRISWYQLSPSGCTSCQVKHCICVPAKYYSLHLSINETKPEKRCDSIFGTRETHDCFLGTPSHQTHRDGCLSDLKAF